VTNNEFMSWVVKGYIEGMKGMISIGLKLLLALQEKRLGRNQ
jgi:hypothetical protein